MLLAARTGRYPFLEALVRTPEIALVLVVALTVTLHALTMVLLEGRVQPHRLLFLALEPASLGRELEPCTVQARHGVYGIDTVGRAGARDGTVGGVGCAVHRAEP